MAGSYQEEECVDEGEGEDDSASSIVEATAALVMSFLAFSMF